MNRIILAILLATLAFAADTTTTKKKTPTKSKARRTATKAVPRGPARQLTPSAERYKEIQQALVDKGYLKSAPTGVWDAESTDAMRRLQADQKLEPTGKLTARSLTALGLGTKEDTAPVPITAVPPASQAPASKPSQP